MSVADSIITGTESPLHLSRSLDSIFSDISVHRANHRFPILWRFHEVHHSDDAMDVTTSGRFHFVELGLGAIIRLPVLYVCGVTPNVLLVYETTLVAVSMLHHSLINLGRLDPILRTFIVTPAMHSIHHSRDPIHFERNFSSVLSIWTASLVLSKRLPAL